MLRTARLVLVGIVAVPALIFWLGRGDADFDRSIPAAKGDALAIDLRLTGPFAWDRGTLTIVGHDEEAVRVEVDGSGWGQYALDLDVDDTSDGVRVAGRLDGFFHWAFGGPAFDIVVHAPPGVLLDLHSDNVPVEIEDLRGAIVARVESGDVSVERAEGDVRIRASGSIDVEDVSGGVALDTERGDIRAQGVQGDVRVHTERGAIRIASVDGKVDSSTARGTVRIERVRGDLRVASDRGRIDVEDVRGRVDVESDRGRIEIRGQDGAVVARSGRGRIDVEFAGMPSGRIVTDRGSIRVEVPRRAGFDFEATTSRGSVRVDDDLRLVSAAPRRLAGGDASQLPGIPEDGHPDLPVVAEPPDRDSSADRDWGDWDWDWDDHDSDGRGQWSDGRRASSAAGSINGGGPLLRLHSGRGSIEIED